MKKVFVLLLALLMIPTFTACAKKNTTIRLSTTTSVNDSGLLPYLQPTFEADTGYKLEITSAGSGAAIQKARTGDADVLLVHSPADEDKLVADGFGVKRITFMYNYFIIVGPASDPAGIKGLKSASEAFTKIANTAGAKFVSRGDNSGTNAAEKKIWTTAAIDPTGKPYYVSTGQGMGASITVAAEQQAYILTDKATYLSHAMKSQLTVLVSESDQLKNSYSMIAVSPDKWVKTNTEGTNAFINWMTSDKAKALIAKYGVDKYGEQLFYLVK